MNPLAALDNPIFQTPSEAIELVGGAFVDTVTIDFTYDSGTDTISADLISLTGFDTGDLAEGSNLYFTNERAQDAIGGILTDSGTIDFTYDDAANTITAIVINNSITYAKMQDISATQRILGKNSAGSGDPEEITIHNALDWITTTDNRIPYRSTTWTTSANMTFDGTTFTANTVDINGGAIDGTTIGSSSATTGKFTTVTATTRVDSGAAGSLTLSTNNGTAQALITHTASATRTVNMTGSNGANPSIGASAGSLALSSNWTASGRTCADGGTVTTIDINGGTLDGTSIGASARSTALFTTLGANSTVTFSSGGSMTGTWTDLGTVTTIDINGGTVDGTVIGGSSAAAGTFTIATATTRVDSGAAGDLILATNNGTAQVRVKHIAGAAATVNLYGGNANSPHIAASTGGALTLGSDSTTVQVKITGNSTNTRFIQLTGSNGGNPLIAASAGNLAINSGWTAASQTCADLGTVTTADINGGTLDGVTIGGSSAAAGTFTSLTATGAVALSPANANVVLSPTGTGVVTINPATAGTLNNVAIGGTTAAAGSFTTFTFTTGQIALARGGTNADLSATGGANQVLQQTSVGGAITVGTLDAASIGAGTLSTARLGSGTADARSFLRGDQTWARSWNLIAKSADQSKTSDTTRAADSELVLSLSANKTYIIKIVVFANYGNGRIKWKFTGPASPTIIKYIENTIINSAPTTLVSSYLEAYPGTDSTATTGNSVVEIAEFIIQNGANAGTFAFEWAQNSSNVSATTVLKGSYLQYSQVD